MYFRVWTKDGKVIDYGNSPNTDSNTKATITAAYPVDATTQYAKAWMISHAVDIFGNAIDYKYDQRTINWGTSASSQGGREWTLSEMEYSGNKVVFSYSDRSTGFPPQDGTESYSTIDKTLTLRRLASISTYINAPYSGTLGVPSGAVPVATTKFGYTASAATSRSLLTSIQTCAGGPTSATCAPTETFKYTSGGGDQTYKELTSNLASAPLYTQPPAPVDPSTWGGFGALGLITGDFDGDGRTDLIRWSATDPSQNQLFISNGDGTFTDRSSAFNIKDQLLFRQDGCVQTSAQDFDNDGLLDLLVYSSSTSWMSGSSTHPGYTLCDSPAPPNTSAIYHNNGDGTFTRQLITITKTDGTTIPLDQTTGDAIQYLFNPTTGERRTYWAEGHVYFLLDLDGDGLLDLVTSMRPLRPSGTPDSIKTVCPGICTHVFKGDGHGNFTEQSTNIGSWILYSAQSSRLSLSHNVYDSNSDGYPDLYTAELDGLTVIGSCIICNLMSRGDFNFDVVDMFPLYYTNSLVSPADGQFIDYNGDGRNDSYLHEFVMMVQDRASGAFKSASTFNLTQNGQLDAGPSSPLTDVVADLNGDGRQDFMRVNTFIPNQKYTTTDSSAYLSNGDSTFTKSTTYNIDALLAADGFTTSAPANSWVLGDFTGHGQPEILASSQMKNVLYVRANQAPTDMLYQTTDSSGATTTFDYVPLANPVVAGETLPRYTTDRLTVNAASGTKADVNAGGFVVSTMHQDNGVGGTINTDYWYAGLKRDLMGRGSLGFRDLRRQHVAPDGSLVTDQNIFAQDFPYTGEALQTNTFHAPENSISGTNQLEATTNIYCDQTAAAGADSAALSSGLSCTSVAASRRPYTLWTKTKAWDISGASLPTKTRQSGINADGAPTTTIDSATVPGTSGVFTQTTANQYPATDDVACSAIDTCHWILARVQRTTVSSSVPSTILSASAGTAPLASATSGNADFARITSVSFGAITVGTKPVATQIATVSNPGDKVLTFPVPSAASVAGTDFGFGSTTCTGTLQYLQTCTITVSFAPSAAVSRSGGLSISTNEGVLTATLAGTGAVPTVVIHPELANWGTVGIGSDSGDWPTVTNMSTAPVLITAHTVASGPTGAVAWPGQTGYCMPGTTVLQPGSSCKTFFGMGTSTVTGTFTATEQISYQVVGNTSSTFSVQQVFTFARATTTANVSALTFSNTPVNSTSAQQTFTLTNNATASPVNVGVSMVGNQPPNFPMTNNCGTNLLAGASCAVTVSFNPTWVSNGFSAAIQVAITYPRMSGGTVEAYYYAAPPFSIPVGGNGLGSVATLTSAATLAVPATWFGGGAQNVTATYRNDGNAPLTLGSPVLVAPLSVTSNSCAAVAVGASCSIVVTAATNVPGISMSQSFVPTGANVAPSATTITWTTQSAVPHWSATSLSFGTVLVGTSTSQNITLINDGNVAYNWATANTIGNAPLGFTFNSAACSNVAAGGNCNVVVTFSPSVQGTTYSGSSISMAAASYNTNTFSVTGVGGGSSATLTSAGTLGVPPTWYGGGAQNVIATYRNDGNLPMTLLAPTLAAPLSVSSNSCSAIAAGASCSIVVTAVTNVPGISMSQSFAPTGANLAPASTTVTWSTQTAVPHWGATALSFGTVLAGTSASQNITLTNDGNVAYNWSANNTISNPPAGYSFNTSTCANVAPGGSCNVVVTFLPSLFGTTYSYSNISMSAASYNTNTFSVTGAGGGSSATLTTAATLPIPVAWFGAAAQSVTAGYRNDGSLPMTLAAPSLTAPLSVTSNNCSAVAAGASCSIVVSAATNVPGIAMGQSFSPTGANLAPAATTVTWTTQTAVPHWSPTSLAFGGVETGTSASQNITLINDGDVAYNWAANSTINNSPVGYSFNTTACGSVAPGGNCNVVVTFTPAANQTYAGSNISMTAASFNTNTFAVSGSSLTVPSVAATPSSYINSTVAPQPVSTPISFYNSGQTPTILQLSLSGGASFSPTTVSCPANGSCGSVTVTTPSVAGNYSGTLSSTSSAGGVPASATLTMTVVSPANLSAFTVVSTTGLTTTFKNPNQQAVTPSASGISLNNGGEWGSVSSNTCAAAVGPLATCSIVIVVPVPDCIKDNYSANAYVTVAGSMTNGSTVKGTSTRATCP